MKYKQIYKSKNVWGKLPNELLQTVYSRLRPGSVFLDLGCGQGRDSLFMLEKGFIVDAVDTSQAGLDSIKEFIQVNSLPVDNINLFCSDIFNFPIQENKYDIINAYNSLQFLPKAEALETIDSIKDNLKSGSYVIISGFTVNDPLYKKIGNSQRCFFEPQELKGIFAGFDFISYNEEVIDDKGHSGNPEPHQHGIVKLIACKTSG